MHRSRTARVRCRGVLARLGVIGVLAGTLLALMPATSQAYVATGPRWPGGTIRFYQAVPASHTWQINAAVRAWNTSGANVRFLRVRSRARAQLVIRYGSTGSAAATATRGYHGRVSYLTVRRPSRGRATVTESRADAARLYAHEMGHVIGLDHVRRNAGCQLMAQYLRACLETAPRPWFWHCRILMFDDLRGAIRLYGRRARPRGIRNFCLREPLPPAVSSLTATSTGPDAPVSLAWSTVRGAMPRPGTVFEVEVHASACGAIGSSRPFQRYRFGRARRAGNDAAAAAYTPGSYCYRIRTVSMFGFPTRFVSRDVTISSAPPAAPTLTSLALHPWADDPTVDYLAGVTLPPNSTLQVMHGPAGACPSALDASGYGNVRVSPTTEGWALSYVPDTGPGCLSFFAVRDGSWLVSAPTSMAIDHPAHA